MVRDPTKSGKTSVLDTFCVCLSVWGWGLGVDWGWMPLPTRPRRYCDHVSLNFFGRQKTPITDNKCALLDRLTATFSEAESFTKTGKVK